MASSAGAAVGAGLALGAPALLGQDSGKKFKVGLIGCGGRGTGAANDNLKAYGTEIVAVADLFPEKAEGAARSFKVPKEKAFSGFDAYRKLLETDVDIVLLATPPHFRPEHLEAAVNAKKHVFMEKPVAVDPVGVRRVIAAGEKAKELGLSIVAGTQRRHQLSYLETVKRIQDGAIGDLVAGRCYWCQGSLWVAKRVVGTPSGSWSDTEWMVRNWLYFTWLSGDHIVEQHIHNLDVMNWFLGSHPVRARGMGGRQVRTDSEFGNIFDHHAIDFEYPNGVHIFSMCRQIDGCWNDVSEHVVGTKGRSNCGDEIAGQNPWRFPGGGQNPYVQEHADLLESIRHGKPINEARQVAESTLTAIMGREASYTGKVIVWEELMKSDLRLGPEKYEFGPFPVEPVARPG
ncbi:MAG: Gfo/Idh/MocA family oxidoreductase [Planctomycetes bacterium]|nr:Gfo/Idh/MocA family oxidoreductase [Planctomycetota bacterium]